MRQPWCGAIFSPSACYGAKVEGLVSNISVSTFAFRASALLWTLLFVASAAGSGNKSQSRYPNELKAFQFYAKYLAPLEPGVSDQEAVRRILGDTAAVRRNSWTINPTFTAKTGPVYRPDLGSLAKIIVRPDGFVPMGSVKFSASFAHCHASLSEINISFDVYTDTFGLEYWLHQETSRWGTKGDLYQIVYGPKRRSYPPNTVYC